MKNAESPYLADLFAISLRWLTLFGLTISLGSGGLLAPLTIAALMLPVLWNGFVSALALLNRRIAWHRVLNVLMDVLSALALFITVGRMSSEVFWVALLPLFSAGIYFSTPGALIVAVIMSILQSAYSYTIYGGPAHMLNSLLVVIFNIIAGAVTAWLSVPMIRRLRTSYQSTINQRRESERRVQRMERERMKALFSLIETFSSTLNYQTVLDTSLDTAISGMGMSSTEEQMMVGAVLLFGNSNELEVRSSRGFTPRDQSITLPAEQGGLCEALKAGEAHMVINPGQDPEMSKFVTMQDRKVALCLPLIRGMNAYGLMVFAHNNEEFFYQDRIEALQMLSNQAVIALQNARLYQDLAREKERIVQTQEEAQKKLARDLHDGPTQSVSAIAMRINIARKMLEKSVKTAGAAAGVGADPFGHDHNAGTQEAIDELVKVEDLARRTTQEIRHMLFTLRPLILESEGLVAALQTMADKMRDLYQQNVIIDADEVVVNQLDMPRQTVVFYLAEEAVNNARKHAKASEICVRIKYPGNETGIAMLEVADNGEGFDVKAIMGSYDRRGSLGMVNLRERTDLVNGLLRIDSFPGKGTRIRVFIPLNEQAADRLHHSR